MSTSRAPATSRELVEQWRTELSRWGEWGTSDTAGSLNFITDESRLAACRLASHGTSVSCSRPIETGADGDDPAPALHLMVRTFSPDARSDFLALTPHGFGVSHIDALGHFTFQGRTYNGFEPTNGAATPTATLGVDLLKDGVVARGILLDVPRHRGVPYLEPGEPVENNELDQIAEAAGIGFRRGDVVLVRTGRWARRHALGRWDVSTALAGLSPECLPWLRSREFAALGSDGVNDVVPSMVPGVQYPIHEVGLVSMGLPLLDNLDLEALARLCDSFARWEFLLVVAPLVVPHGTSSPANPIAIF